MLRDTVSRQGNVRGPGMCYLRADDLVALGELRLDAQRIRKGPASDHDPVIVGSYTETCHCWVPLTMHNATP